MIAGDVIGEAHDLAAVVDPLGVGTITRAGVGDCGVGEHLVRPDLVRRHGHQGQRRRSQHETPELIL